MAYQGFATGVLQTDNQAVKDFVNDGIKIFCGASYSKNMGMYGTRTGCLSITTDSEQETLAIKSQLSNILRNTWSNPPLHGAKIAEIVMSTPEFETQWHKDMLMMTDRIKGMRSAFVDGLKASGSTHNWGHILDQIGMFAYTGVGKKRCERLISEFHIYLTLNGRVSICGLNSGNMDYVTKAFHEVTKDGLN